MNIAFDINFPGTVHKDINRPFSQDHFFDLSDNIVYEIFHCMSLLVLLHYDLFDLILKPVLRLPKVILIHKVYRVRSYLLEVVDLFHRVMKFSC